MKGVPGTYTTCLDGTYWAARGCLAEGSVDAVGAGVEGAGVAEVVSRGGIAAPQGGMRHPAVGTLTTLP